jgi:hypothetical protein
MSSSQIFLLHNLLHFTYIHIMIAYDKLTMKNFRLKTFLYICILDGKLHKLVEGHICPPVCLIVSLPMTRYRRRSHWTDPLKFDVGDIH